jgi:hypothetical protein
MMTALRNGQTLRLFAVRSARLREYFNSHPDYACEAVPLMEANKKLAIQRKGNKYRDLTHCKYGHPLSGDNVYLYLAPGRRERRCYACITRRHNAPLLPTQEQVQRATAALNAGKTISEICFGRIGDRRIGKAIVTFNKLKLYRQQNPDFNSFVLSSTADNNSRAQIRRHAPEKIRAQTLRAETNDFYAIVNMVPSGFPPDVRDDIAQSILMALLEGSLQRDQVRDRVRHFVTAHHRMFPTKFAKFGDSPLLSLDEVMFDDGTATRGDTVSRGLWD